MHIKNLVTGTTAGKLLQINQLFKIANLLPE